MTFNEEEDEENTKIERFLQDNLRKKKKTLEI